MEAVHSGRRMPPEIPRLSVMAKKQGHLVATAVRDAKVAS